MSELETIIQCKTCGKVLVSAMSPIKAILPYVSCLKCGKKGELIYDERFIKQDDKGRLNIEI